MTGMASLIRAGERIAPFHYALDEAQWRAMLTARGRTLPLLSAWADERRVHVLLLEGDRPLMASTSVEDRRYLAPSSRFPAAEWGERVSYDLFGVEAMESRGEGGPALDEGAWESTWPLSARPGPGGGALPPPDCMAPGIAGPLGLSFDGKRVTIRAGFAHRGVPARMIGLEPAEALRFAARAAGGGNVAHALAFRRAVVQAQGRAEEAGTRDFWLILLEIERIGQHLLDMAGTARLMDSGLFAAHLEHAREALARVSEAHGFGRRLTAALEWRAPPELEIVPFAQAARDALAPRMEMLTGLQRIFASRLEGVGVLEPGLAARCAVGGVAGRASGRDFDLRRAEPGMRLDALGAVGSDVGDAQARDALRLAEMRDSLALIGRILGSYGMEAGAFADPASGEGIGAAEGARGDVWYWVRLREGRIGQIHARDPSAALLPVLGDMLAAEGRERAAFVLRSLGFSPAGAAL